MIVVDTKVIGYLFLSSPRSEQVESVLQKDGTWVAPLLWRSEFRNVLAVYLRKGFLDLEQARQIMEKALDLMRGGEFDVPSWEVLRLAAESGCSAYDCEFIALAKDSLVSLVTVDRQLLDAFPGIAVPLDAFLFSNH